MMMSDTSNINTTHSVLSVRVETLDKEYFDRFCKKVGMNASVAINIFIKNVLREQRLPFSIGLDPFYSDTNLKRLDQSVKQLNSGKGIEHDLVKA